MHVSSTQRCYLIPDPMDTFKTSRRTSAGGVWRRGNTQHCCWDSGLLTGTEIVTAKIESTPENPNEIRNRMEEISSLECSSALQKPE